MKTLKSKECQSKIKEDIQILKQSTKSCIHTVQELFSSVITSPDATLPIKLLESLSQFAKEQKRTQETQSIYFSPQIKSKGSLELNFSLAPLNNGPENTLIENTFQEPLALKKPHISFNANKSCLTLNFDIEIKTCATHV